MSDGNQSYTAPTINPIVGGVVGMTPLGSRFMRGYGVASELQMREYERRRREEERKQLEQALGMPIGTFEGQQKALAAKELARKTAEETRLQAVEAESRGPVKEPFSFGSFRYLAKPPAIPPEVSAPPSLAATPAFIDSRGQTRIEEEGGPAATLTPPTPTYEAPTPSEIEGQGGEGFTERPPTPAEMWSRQVAGGAISAEKAVTEDRKRRDEAEIAAVLANAEKLKLTDEERLQIQAAVASGSGAQARYAIAKVLQNRREAVLEEESDRAIDADPNLTPQSKALLKTQPVKSRQALVTHLKEADKKAIYREQLADIIRKTADRKERELQARLDIAERSNNRQVQQTLFNDLRKEVEGHQRAINAADNGLAMLESRMIAEDSPEYQALRQKRATAQALYAVSQAALNRLQGATGQYPQPGSATEPTGEPPASAPAVPAPAAPAAPAASPPPAVPAPATTPKPKPKGPKYNADDDPAGLFK